MDILIKQADIPKNLTNNLNKNCHSYSLNQDFCKKNWFKTVLLGRKLQISRFRHPEALKVLLLS